MKWPMIALISVALAPAAIAGPRPTGPVPTAASPASQRSVAQPKPPPLKPYLLKISIKTGDDDLRSDSSAWLDVDFVDGPVRCWLRNSGGETWQNNHTYPATCLVNVRSPREMKAARFGLGYNGGPGEPGDTTKMLEDMSHGWDNWNVDEVRVDGVDPVTHRTDCILYAVGSPLVRMTGQNPRIELLPASYPCP